MDDTGRSRIAAFRLIPSLAVIGNRPVFVEGDRYSQLAIEGGPTTPMEAVRKLMDAYGAVHYIDILSYRTGEPDLSTLRAISSIGGELWTDVGAEGSETLIDAIMAGASTCVVTTKMIADLNEIASAFELTEDLAVQLDLDGGPISPDPEIRSMTPSEFGREMVELGIGTLILDFQAGNPPEARLMTISDVIETVGGKARVFIGMEAMEEQDELIGRGASGGLISCSKLLKGVEGRTT